MPMALAAPAGAEAKETDVNDLPDTRGLRPQAGKGDDRSDQLQRAEQERRVRLGGRAADQGPVPHPRRAGEPHTRDSPAGFALVVQPGHYVINCPGASQQHATFTVTGKAKVVSAQTKSLLAGAAVWLRHLCQPAGGRPGVLHPGPLRRHQRGQPDARPSSSTRRPASSTSASSRSPRSGARSIPPSTAASTTR